MMRRRVNYWALKLRRRKRVGKERVRFVMGFRDTGQIEYGFMGFEFS